MGDREALATRDHIQCSPPIPSQGKNLNVLMNDCAALPTGDCAALPTGDRSHLGTFHVRFPVGKRLTVNVFRQRMNQLFQGGGDIWRGIAKHLHLRDRIAFPTGDHKVFHTGDCEALPVGDRIALPTGSRI
ncbi:hypothetical protein [Cylindrospermopsis raciborskii]|uniref:hypothetical protein n=2 Tax=Aphanizomenonaceae TaxID=1892259 RepID=UPI003DA272D0